MHAMPLMLGVLACLAIAFRFYSKFLAAKVAVLDDSRPTPAHTLNDGQNYHPTNKWVLFGHHFAAISGAGPLVGPVLALQFGYLPGLLWLVIGVVLGGAAQDFMVLVCSTRRKGRSLAVLARLEIGSLAGTAAGVAILFIIVNALAGLGLVVVKALGGESNALPLGSVFTLEPEKDPAPRVSLVRADGKFAIYDVPGPSSLAYEGLRRPIQSEDPVRVAVPLAALGGRAPESLARPGRFEPPPGAE